MVVCYVVVNVVGCGNFYVELVFEVVFWWCYYYVSVEYRYNYLGYGDRVRVWKKCDCFFEICLLIFLVMVMCVFYGYGGGSGVGGVCLKFVFLNWF